MHRLQTTSPTHTHSYNSTIYSVYVSSVSARRRKKSSHCVFLHPEQFWQNGQNRRHLFGRKSERLCSGRLEPECCMGRSGQRSSLGQHRSTGRVDCATHRALRQIPASSVRQYRLFASGSLVPKRVHTPHITSLTTTHPLHSDLRRKHTTKQQQ